MSRIGTPAQSRRRPAESAGRRLRRFSTAPAPAAGAAAGGAARVAADPYLGSLAVLFVAAFWRLDPFTAEVVHDYGFQNFQTLWESDVYRTIAQRTF